MRGRRVAFRVGWAMAVAGLVAGTTGCTVSTNDDPQAAGARFDEFVQSTTTTSSTTTPENATKTEPVYFLTSNTRTASVERPFEVGASIAVVLESLFTDPPDTSGEEAPLEQGLQTAIPESAVLTSAEMSSSESSRLVIDTTLFDTVQGSTLRNALAQIVLTATSSPNVESVSFTQDGEPRRPIIGSGETVERAVTRDDYRTLG